MSDAFKSNESDALRRIKRKKGAPAFRLLILVVSALAFLACSIWLILWWEDRPLRIADSYLKSGHPDDAMKAIEGFLQREPHYGPAIGLKARILVDLNRPADACRLFDQVGAATDEEMRSCSKAYLMLQRWLHALPLLEYLHSAHPHDANLLHELSACRAKLGRYDDAILAAQKFAELPDCEARGYTLIGLLETERGNHRRACEAWQHVMTISPDAEGLQVPPEEFLCEYGAALLKTGKPSAAITLLRRSVEIIPGARSLALLGKANLQEGNNSEAESAWLRAVSLDQTNEDSRQGLAELALKNANYAAALDWLTPLADSKGVSSGTAFLLQRAYSLTGNPESGQKWLTRATEIRRREERERTVDQIAIDSPLSLWGQVLQAYRLAEKGNWEQAGILVSNIKNEESQPFITELISAIRARSTLPDLELLPMQIFQ